MIRPIATFLALLLAFVSLAQADTYSLRAPAAASTRLLQPQLTLTPDHADWTYHRGEPVTFLVRLASDGTPLAGATVSFRHGPEGLMSDDLAALTPTDAPEMAAVHRGTIEIGADGSARITAGTMTEPGFLRCVVTFALNHTTVRAIATAGFEPEKIQPTQTSPSDFDAFWAAGLATLREIPMEPRLTLLPDRCTDKVDVYQVRLQNVPVAGFPRPSYVFGILCEPKGPGPFPAILYVPGAGIRPYPGRIAMAERGVITLEIGIDGLPVDQPPELYDALGRGVAAFYYLDNLDDRDRNYYRRVYLGCVRADDFLVQRPKFDGHNLLVAGGSQGGQLSIVTAALDRRVTGLAATYPAYCDVTGDLHGRAGGWPHMFRIDRRANRTDAKIQATRYYDTVNFARRLRVPGFYTWGYNDETCPPTSLFAAYNAITAPKSLALLLDSGHAFYPAEEEATSRWLADFLKLP
jgi:cephalosporin-C deacetylase-like acetyl esterase